MILASVATRNFRNLEPARVEFHPSANVFVGPNGQGKTNYLEAIYFLATTKSFRTSRVANLFLFDADHVFVEGTCDDKGLRKSLSIGIEAASTRRRELLLNAQKAALEDYVEQLPVIAYSAARLEILRGTPEVRRKFLDRGIASLRRGYIRALGRYARIVEQRNALLNLVADGSSSEAALDPWDIELVDSGRELASARAQYALDLVEEFDRIVAAMRYHVDSLRVAYEPSGAFLGDRDTALRGLADSRRRELAAGFTLSGPHRDNLRFEVEGRDAAEVLSSGEVKMTVLFLKLAKISLFHKVAGERPIFVFDDIDAELDLPVMERLMGFVGSQVQLFASSAKEAVLDHLDLGEHMRIPIENGRVSAGRLSDTQKRH